MMVEAVINAGDECKIGIRVEMAAGIYYDKDRVRFLDLFLAEPKTYDDLSRLHEVEAELGSCAKFIGRAGLKP